MQLPFGVYLGVASQMISVPLPVDYYHTFMEEAQSMTISSSSTLLLGNLHHRHPDLIQNALYLINCFKSGVSSVLRSMDNGHVSKTIDIGMVDDDISTTPSVTKKTRSAVVDVAPSFTTSTTEVVAAAEAPEAATSVTHVPMESATRRALCVMGYDIICCGGSSASQTGSYEHCDRFDTLTMKWFPMPSLNQKRRNARSFVFRNTIYVLGESL
jgi:hypothetical protein